MFRSSWGEALAEKPFMLWDLVNQGRDHYINDRGEITSVWFERRRREPRAQARQARAAWDECRGAFRTRSVALKGQTGVAGL